MLSSMVKEHQTRQQLRREEQERHRKEALQASTNLTNALVDHLNVGVAQAYLNQKRLDAEARRLEQSAAVLQKQTQHWITLVNGFCSALKQVGDVVSWTQVIHKDVATVAATLQHAYTTTYNSTHPGLAIGGVADPGTTAAAAASAVSISTSASSGTVINVGGSSGSNNNAAGSQSSGRNSDVGTDEGNVDEEEEGKKVNAKGEP